MRARSRFAGLPRYLAAPSVTVFRSPLATVEAATALKPAFQRICSQNGADLAPASSLPSEPNCRERQLLRKAARLGRSFAKSAPDIT